MGYTHYWDGNPKATNEQWERFTKQFEWVIASEGWSNIREEIDSQKPPIISKENKIVCFNGADDETGHETFCLKPETSWNFCKTARKEYDLPVCVALLLAKENGIITYLSSDGKFSSCNWPKARRVIKKHLTDFDEQRGHAINRIEHLRRIMNEMTDENAILGMQEEIAIFEKYVANIDRIAMS
jgi:hypothetical protein